MKPQMNFLRPITLLLCETSAGILMKARMTIAQDAAPAIDIRRPSRGPSVHPTGTRTWACSTAMGRYGSRLGGRRVTCCWWVSNLVRSSRLSICNYCGACSASGCFALLSVQTATRTLRSTSLSVSHLCPCQGQVSGRPCLASGCRPRLIFLVFSATLVSHIIILALMASSRSTSMVY